MDNFYYQIDFDNFELLAETARGWELEIFQLDRGSINSRVSQIFNGDVLSASFSTNRTIKLVGTPPQEMWTFEITSPISPPWLLGKNEVTNEAINVFRPGYDFNCIFKPGYDVYNFSLAPEDLQYYCHEFGVPELVDALKSQDIVQCPAGETKMLWLRINEYHCLFKHFSERKTITPFWVDHENALLKDILLTTAKGTSTRINHKAVKRLNIIQEIDDYLEANQVVPLTVRDLCKIVQVSERTLQYNFRSLIGITPQTYLKAIYLNRVRKGLYAETSEDKCISDIANKWGFWHMGQFAADYRRLFGELPSETLHRSL